MSLPEISKSQKSDKPVALDFFQETCWLDNYISLHNKAIGALPNIHSNSFLIYVCDEQCGGVGDRLSGLLSLFYLAVALERVFLIDYTSPVALELTLVPRQMEWNCSKLLPDGLHSESLTMIDTPDKLGALERLKRLVSAQTPVIRVKINRYWLGMYLWMKHDEKHGGVEKEPVFLQGALSSLQLSSCGSFRVSDARPRDTFALGFSKLFDFSPEVKARAVQMYDELNVDPSSDYIAIHARFGGQQKNQTILGWDDPERHKTEDIVDFISCAKSNFTRFGERATTIVLFSDNEEVKESALVSAEGIKTTRSTQLVHVDKSTSNNHDELVKGNVDTFTELYILSRSSCLVGSISTFSGLASSLIQQPNDCFTFFFSCADSVDFWKETENLP